MKKLLLIAALIVLSNYLQADENYLYFAEAQSLKGSTGYVHAFSTRVLPYRAFSFGLHRFISGVNYGFMRGCEIGLSFNLQDISEMPAFDQPNLEKKYDEIFLTSKIRVLKEEEYPLDVSIGSHRDSIYLVTGKYFEDFDSITVQAGVSWNRRETNTFMVLTESLSWQQAIIELEPNKDMYDIGWRFLLSPEMKLDFFIQDATHIHNFLFNNFMFGISIVMQ